MRQTSSLKNSTYPIHNKKAYYALATVDFLLKSLPIRKNFVIPPPKKILIVNLAHLGDVILTTTLLKPIKETFPDVEIGMLIGTWSHPVIEKHPLVNQIHHLNHWKINRTKERGYWTMRSNVLKELKQYDVAIDCAFHFPNTSPLLWQAGIPTRIGFTSAGFGPLLTHALPWKPENRSAALSFFSLLQFLGIEGKPSRPFLPPVKSQERGGYIVIHMGAGHPRKEWHRSKWQKLAQRLNTRLIFTGRGERERETIEWVIQNLPQAENHCDKLSWSEFVGCIQGADLLISVDTSAGHVAAAVDTPAVLLFTGINPVEIWRPYNSKIHVLTKPMPCAPCYQGCTSSACLQQLSVSSIEAAVRSIIALPTLPAPSSVIN